MTSADSRLASFRSFLAHTREQLGLDVGFVLWDGSTVPSDLASDAFAISLADEGVVSSLLRRPKGDTLGNLWVSGEGRSAKRDDPRPRQYPSESAQQSVPQGARQRPVVTDAAEVSVPAARRSMAVGGYSRRKAQPTAGRRRTKRASAITTMSPTRFTRSGSTARWSIAADILRTGKTTSLGPNRTNSR